MLPVCLLLSTGSAPALIPPPPRGSPELAAASLRRRLGRDPRIVGGAEASPFTYPWLGSLQTAYGHSCGGSLVEKQHFLTAAHCVEPGVPASTYKVMFHGHSLSAGDGQHSCTETIEASKVTWCAAPRPRPNANARSCYRHHTLPPPSQPPIVRQVNNGGRHLRAQAESSIRMRCCARGAWAASAARQPGKRPRAVRRRVHRRRVGNAFEWRGLARQDDGCRGAAPLA